MHLTLQSYDESQREREGNNDLIVSMIVSWKVGIMFQNGRGGWRGWIYDVILKGGGASYFILHQLVICTNESFKIQKY